MKKLFMVGAILLLTACSGQDLRSQFTRPVSTGTPNSDACADKFVNAALVSTSTLPGAYDCADPSYQKFLAKQKLTNDDALAAHVRQYGVVKVRACGPMVPYDSTINAKLYEVSAPDGSKGVVVITFNKSDGKVLDFGYHDQIQCPTTPTPTP